MPTQLLVCAYRKPYSGSSAVLCVLQSNIFPVHVVVIGSIGVEGVSFPLVGSLINFLRLNSWYRLSLSLELLSKENLATPYESHL